jgi:hypothetical protein
LKIGVVGNDQRGLSFVQDPRQPSARVRRVQGEIEFPRFEDSENSYERRGAVLQKEGDRLFSAVPLREDRVRHAIGGAVERFIR